MMIFILVWLSILTAIVALILKPRTLKKLEAKKLEESAELTIEEIDTYIDFARQEQAVYERSRVSRRGWHGFTPEQRRTAIAQRAEREAVSRGRKLDHTKILGRVGHG